MLRLEKFRKINYWLFLLSLFLGIIIGLTSRAYAITINNWQYDGRDWYYIDPATGKYATGHQRINHVDYYFAKDGRQVTPYTINYQYQLSCKQGTNQQAHHKYIILHDVGSLTNGKDAAKFMKQTANSNEAYSNFIVGDGGKVYQIKAPGVVSWGAGANANANAPVQIELERTHNPIKFFKDYQTYVRLTRDMAGKFDIPLTLDTGSKGTPGIKAHVWVTKHIWGTHKDPYEYLIRFGVFKWMLAWNLRYGI